jgi:lysophospholipase L1-like esterase
MKKVTLFLVGLIFSFFAHTQIKVVVIGSSTAAGIGADVPANSFVGRLQTYYPAPAYNWTNLAVPGTNTYNALAVSVPGKPPIEPGINITAALALDPDVILVSYPSNDVDLGFSNTETINNLTTIKNLANAQGVLMYFIGNQPRDFTDPAQRTQLSTQNDLLLATFPDNTINVYLDLLGIDGNIATIVSAGDGIHVNSEGHRRIFQRVVDFNIFQTLLPVTYAKFNIQQVDNRIKLSWETATESNNDFFRVERSPDGIQFSPIGTVKGNLNSNSSKKYAFIDDKPLAGKNHYRLAQVDLNGRTQYSKILSINFFTSLSTTIYPNPASDVLQVSVKPSARSAISIEIIGANGSKVYQRNNIMVVSNNTISVPVMNLQKGWYLMKVSSPMGTEHLRFIKQ